MAKYKLTITYEFDGTNLIGEDENKTALDFAHILLLEQHIHGSCVPQVALLRDGDRSGANLLSPIVNSNHYKHGKITLDEYIDSKPGLREAMNDD